MNYLHALLIGIDCYLPNRLPNGASYKSLKGCVRDITLAEAFLKRQFNLPSERIYKLTASNVDGSSEPSEPPEQLPTYENIVGKFKELTEKAQPQDQVYIHYSGHGGRASDKLSRNSRERKELMRPLFLLILVNQHLAISAILS